MPTFLTTARMNSALAARVEASVRGRRATRAGGLRLATSLARAALVFVLCYIVYFAVTTRARARTEMEETRAKLLADVTAASAELTDRDHAATTRFLAWTKREAAGYAGDYVSPELREAGALAALLARPAAYVRGDLRSLESPGDFDEAVAVSTKDPLALCLLAPPATRKEHELLTKVRVAYAGGADMEAATSNLRRLHEAVVVLPLLAPAWTERVRGLDDGNELARLRRDLDHAPVDRGKRAAKSEVLLIAVDEPGAPGAIVELDGERPHAIRLAIVDLARDRVALRLRRDVDPRFVSEAKRPSYARGLDACAFALDVHAALRGADEPQREAGAVDETADGGAAKPKRKPRR